MKKVLNIIKKVFIGIVGVAFFAFAIGMTILVLHYNDYGIAKINETSLVPIKKELSSDKYKKGDLVLIEEKTFNEINEGDEIFIYQVIKGGKVNIDLGIVDRKHAEEDAISFKNGSTYSMEYAIGTASKVYNGWGTYLSIIGSKWGFLFIILVPSFLIFIYEIYALIVEIKYGGKEEIK